MRRGSMIFGVTAPEAFTVGRTPKIVRQQQARELAQDRYPADRRDRALQGRLGRGQVLLLVSLREIRTSAVLRRVT